MNIWGDFVLAQLDPRKIQCQPELPWIKRCIYEIKFTNDIQFVDFDFSCDSENGKKSEGESSDGDEEPKKDDCEKRVEEEKMIKANSTEKNITNKTEL